MDAPELQKLMQSFGRAVLGAPPSALPTPEARAAARHAMDVTMDLYGSALSQQNPQQRAGIDLEEEGAIDSMIRGECPMCGQSGFADDAALMVHFQSHASPSDRVGLYSGREHAMVTHCLLNWPSQKSMMQGLMDTEVVTAESLSTGFPEQGGDIKSSILTAVVGKGVKCEAISWLLDHCSQPRQLLELRSITGDTAVGISVSFKRLDLVKLLHARGANLRIPDRMGATPMWTACCKGDLRMAKFLYANGARDDLTRTTIMGSNCKRIASFYSHKNILKWMDKLGKGVSSGEAPYMAHIARVSDATRLPYDDELGAGRPGVAREWLERQCAQCGKPGAKQMCSGCEGTSVRFLVTRYTLTPL